MEGQTGCSLENQVDVAELKGDYQLDNRVARAVVLDVPEFKQKIYRVI